MTRPPAGSRGVFVRTGGPTMNVWIVTYPDLPCQAVNSDEGGFPPTRCRWSPNSNIPTESTYENRIYSSNSTYLMSLLNLWHGGHGGQLWARNLRLYVFLHWPVINLGADLINDEKWIVECYVMVTGNRSNGGRPTELVRLQHIASAGRTYRSYQLSPRWLVAGVLVTIRRHSTLSVLRNVEGALSTDEETCPSSTMRRFHRTKPRGVFETLRSRVQFVILIRPK